MIENIPTRRTPAERAGFLLLEWKLLPGDLTKNINRYILISS